MFLLAADALDATGTRLHPHRGEGERLGADAHVLLVGPATAAGTDGVHFILLAGLDEGLGRPGAVSVRAQVRLPGLFVVQRSGSARRQVAAEEVVVAVVPFGAHAGEVVVGVGLTLVGHGQEDGEGEEYTFHGAADLV